MNIQELEKEIDRVRNAIKKTSSIKLKNDFGKYLKKLTKERNDYYRFKGVVR
jgi:hypothetical protein